MKSISLYFKQTFRLLLSSKMQEAFVWRDLKNGLHKTEWMSGVNEGHRSITVLFEIGPDTEEKFSYSIEDRACICRVNILSKFPYEKNEIVADVFRLTDYFNGTLSFARLFIYTRDIHYFNITLYCSSPLLVNLIDTDALHDQVYWHYCYAKDIYHAFQRLIHEGEEPEILMGDFLQTIKMRQTPQN